MNDVVKRLRTRWGFYFDRQWDVESQQLFCEAADEIERLQYGIRMALECIDGDANDPTGAAQYLRGALKEKRDE